MAEPPCSHSDVEGRRRSKIFDDGDPPRDQDGGWRKKIVAFSPIILGGGALHQLLNSRNLISIGIHALLKLKWFGIRQIVIMSLPTTE